MDREQQWSNHYFAGHNKKKDVKQPPEPQQQSSESLLSTSSGPTFQAPSIQLQPDDPNNVYDLNRQSSSYAAYLDSCLISNMTPLGSTAAMANASNTSLLLGRSMADDARIRLSSAPSLLTRSINNSNTNALSLGYPSTSSGDLLVVRPSLDNTSQKTPLESGDDCQARSPRTVSQLVEGAKDEQRELLNPTSQQQQQQQQAHQSQNLSAHFYDAASLKDRSGMEDDEVVIVASDNQRNQGIGDGSEGSRKHRRMFSDDGRNPHHQLHRRLDSRGTRGSVSRNDARYHHHREDSAGLDILSAAAGATAEELASAAGAPHPADPRTSPTYNTWEPPLHHHPSEARPSLGQVSAESYDPQAGYTMPPPSHQSRTTGHNSMGWYPPYVPQGYQQYPSQQPPHSAQYYGHPSAAGPRSHPSALSYGMNPPLQPPHPDMHAAYSNETAPAPASDSWQSQMPSQPEASAKQPNHQGSQTFVTAISVGPGNKTLQATGSTKNVSTNTTNPPPNSADDPIVPSQSRHHRKMSSFSSLGSILHPSMFSPDSDKGHHRKTSSSLSFLQDINMALDHGDDPFLKNLQAWSASVAGMDFRAPTPQQQQHQPPQPLPAPPTPAAAPELASSVETISPPLMQAVVVPSVSDNIPHRSPIKSVSIMVSQPLVDNSDDSKWESGSKLASGGTSKRLRRKCTVDGCENRVVQGGLCISHGARRKTCKHPGCTKNVKKAGLCSTHGPARKRCEFDGCSKVAVQGGRCIAHGAKKKLCSVRSCSKQAILSGMCKKHHDQANARGGSSRTGTSRKESKWDSGRDSAYCQEINPLGSSLVARNPSHKPSHTRGLSIFQETPLDMLSSVLNEAPPPAP